MALGLSLGLGLGARSGTSLAAQVAALFGPGDAGFWSGGFDPAAGRVFQDSALTTPVTTFGQPIGGVVRQGGTLNALQATAGDRPLSARRPPGGRRNLLVASEAFGDAAWEKNGGAWSGGEFTPVSGSGVSFNDRGIMGGIVTNAAVQVSGFFDVAASDLRYICYGMSNGHGGYTATVAVDTQTWTVVATGTHPSYTSGISGSVEAIPGGHRLRWTATKLDTSPSTPVICPSSAYGVAYNRNVTTDGVGGITLLRAQGGLGATTGAYQAVTTAYDVTEAGQPDRWSLVNVSSDALNVTLPAGTYTRAWVTPAGDVTIQTGQSLSGTESILRATETADVLYIDRALDAGEQALLTAYWESLYAA